MAKMMNTTMVPSEDTSEFDLPVLRATPRFDSFYRAEFQAVSGLAHALSGSRLGAEDLAQEGFLAAYRRWDEIGNYENPSAWVRRVVANRSVSVMRRRIVEAKALPKLLQPDMLLPEMNAVLTISGEQSDGFRSDNPK
jgi:DNA-directed RNA polymerase specialized sigma24 family protein